MSSSQDTKSDTSSSTLSSKEKDETQKPPPRDSSGKSDDSTQADAGSKDKNRKRSLSENFKSLCGGKCKISPLNPPSADSSNPSQHSNPRSSVERSPRRRTSINRVAPQEEPDESRMENEPSSNPSQHSNPRSSVERSPRRRRSINRVAPQEESDESRMENEPSETAAHRQKLRYSEFSSPKKAIFRVILGTVGCNRERYSEDDLKEFYKFIRFFCDGFTTWWVLLAIFYALLTFVYLQPDFDETLFVEREYHYLNETTCLPSTDISPQCLTPNETSLLNGEHINRFVRTLHSIITEDCHKILDRYNIAVDFEEDRPLINDDMIFDGLVRYFNYTIDEARLLIKTCRVVFNRTYHDVVAVRDHEFIYLNDSLMKYCNFKTNFVKDITMCLLIFVGYFMILVPIRWIFFITADHLQEWYIENWIKG